MTNMHITFRDTQNLHSLLFNVKKEAEYNQTPPPKVQFHGTVKLHGTHMDVVETYESEMYAQGRNDVLSTSNPDSFGFFTFFQNRKNRFSEIFKDIRKNAGFDTSEMNVVINGEWCGGNIQKGVAISNLDKMFVAHDIKFVPKDQSKEQPSFYKPSLIKFVVGDKLYNSDMFKHWDVEVDLSCSVEQIIEQLMPITLDVEKTCPVGDYFNVYPLYCEKRRFDNNAYTLFPKPIVDKLSKKCVLSGYVTSNSLDSGFVEYTVYDDNMNAMFSDKFSVLGEGVVWSADDSKILFKLKGEKHGAVNKVVRERSHEEDELAQAKADFAFSLLPDWRMEQGLQSVPSNESKYIKDYLAWIFADVLKEESVKIDESGFTIKELNAYISKFAVQYFKNSQMEI